MQDNTWPENKITSAYYEFLLEVATEEDGSSTVTEPLHWNSFKSNHQGTSADMQRMLFWERKAVYNGEEP
jgi:hypothetical protein